MCYSLAYLNFTFTPYLQTIKGNKIMGTTKSTNWQEVYQIQNQLTGRKSTKTNKMK